MSEEVSQYKSEIIRMMSAELARLEVEVQKLRYALMDVSELIDGYVDICDGDEETGPRPNDAMRAQQRINEALNRNDF